jgi:hypothetical protein
LFIGLLRSREMFEEKTNVKISWHCLWIIFVQSHVLKSYKKLKNILKIFIRNTYMYFKKAVFYHYFSNRASKRTGSRLGHLWLRPGKIGLKFQAFLQFPAKKVHWDEKLCGFSNISKYMAQTYSIQYTYIQYSISCFVKL